MTSKQPVKLNSVLAFMYTNTGLFVCDFRSNQNIAALIVVVVLDEPIELASFVLRHLYY